MEEGPKVPVVASPTRESWYCYVSLRWCEFRGDSASTEASPCIYRLREFRFWVGDVWAYASSGDPEEDVDDGYAKVFSQMGEDSGGGC